MNSKVRGVLLACSLIGMMGGLQADELEIGKGNDYIGLTADKPYLHVIHNGKSVKVQRVQDPDFELKGYFAKTARKCPPFCIREIEADPRVQTVAEVEVFQFMENELRDGVGLLIDSRTPNWYQRGTIPGSLNYPFTLLSKDPKDPELIAVLEEFGAVPRKELGFIERQLEAWGMVKDELKTDEWDFSNAKDLVIWCNGPACGQSPRAIKGLLAAGYPPRKIKYYRGGMQMWQLFGLNTIATNTE